MKNCCFTGHRNLKITQKLKDNLKSTLENLINQGVTDFYAGGALGWDMLCEHTVVELRQKYPHIRLHLILPCSEELQIVKWNDSQKADFFELFRQADSIEYTSWNYFNGCMKKRNARLVELSDCCVCYYNNKKSASGTGQTVRMAQKKGIYIIFLH